MQAPGLEQPPTRVYDTALLSWIGLVSLSLFGSVHVPKGPGFAMQSAPFVTLRGLRIHEAFG